MEVSLLVGEDGGGHVGPGVASLLGLEAREESVVGTRSEIADSGRDSVRVDINHITTLKVRNDLRQAAYVSDQHRFEEMVSNLGDTRLRSGLIRLDDEIGCAEIRGDLIIRHETRVPSDIRGITPAGVLILSAIELTRNNELERQIGELLHRLTEEVEALIIADKSEEKEMAPGGVELEGL